MVDVIWQFKIVMFGFKIVYYWQDVIIVELFLFVQLFLVMKKVLRLGVQIFLIYKGVCDWKVVIIKLYIRIYFNVGNDIEMFEQIRDVIFFFGGVFGVNVVLCEIV